jgi:hypothetical protein
MPVHDHRGPPGMSFVGVPPSLVARIQKYGFGFIMYGGCETATTHYEDNVSQYGRYFAHKAKRVLTRTWGNFDTVIQGTHVPR